MFLTTSIGVLELNIKGNMLCDLAIRDDKELPELNSPATGLASEISLQLQSYFSGSGTFHDIPLLPAGTPFEKKVWNELQRIPSGETRTYGEIAKILNSSPQAVGNACRKNPIAIIIPCHRVVSATGLGGYAGQTGGRQLEIKRWLLQHEGAIV